MRTLNVSDETYTRLQMRGTPFRRSKLGTPEKVIVSLLDRYDHDDEGGFDTLVGTLDAASSDVDEGRFSLTLSSDVGDVRLYVGDVPTAKALLSAVSRLRSWIADHDRERAAYDAASPEERDRVISGAPAERPDVWDVDGDQLRKAARENG